MILPSDAGFHTWSKLGDLTNSITGNPVRAAGLRFRRYGQITNVGHYPSEGAVYPNEPDFVPHLTNVARKITSVRHVVLHVGLYVFEGWVYAFGASNQTRQ